MSENWITADWHLGEDQFEIRARPFTTKHEMVDELIKCHNELVKPDDTVYVVGDVCCQKATEYLPNVHCFNGKKVLIRGNHDRNTSNDEFYNYFDQIVEEGDGIELDIENIPCYITHYPSKGRVDRFNLVGHVHSAWKYQLNMLNIGVDVHHFRPVNLKTIPFHLEAISLHYDLDIWIAYNEINSQYVGKRGKQSTYF